MSPKVYHLANSYCRARAAILTVQHVRDYPLYLRADTRDISRSCIYYPAPSGPPYLSLTHTFEGSLLALMEGLLGTRM